MSIWSIWTELVRHTVRRTKIAQGGRSPSRGMAVARRHTRRLCQRVPVVLTALLIVGVMPASAQGDVCSAGFLQLVGTLQVVAVEAGLMILTIGIILGIVFRALPFSGTQKLGNKALAGVLLAIIGAVLAFSVVKMGLSYSPIDASQNCGSILG